MFSISKICIKSVFQHLYSLSQWFFYLIIAKYCTPVQADFHSEPNHLLLHVLVETWTGKSF